MRTLFAVCPGIGQCLPLLPLAHSLRAAGGDVLFATCGEALVVTNAGLPVADIGGAETTMTTLQRRLKRDRPDVVATVRALPPSSPERLALGYAHISAYLVDATLAVARAWQPDVIVCSPLNAAGLLAASAQGVPAAHHGVGPVRTQGLAEIAHAELHDAFGAHALPDPLVELDVVPSSVAERVAGAWPMRYVPFDGGLAAPWLRQPTERARLAVTVGTVVPRESGLSSLAHVLDATRHVDAEVVIAMRERDVVDLPSTGPNVRVAGWNPMATLLRTCAGVIHHGGAGTTMAALVAGVPQLVVPDGADRHINAAAVQRAGVGLIATPGTVTASLVRRVLEDEHLRTAAHAVAAEIHAMPAPTDVAARLAAMCDAPIPTPA